jgi:hypothetical protein
MEQHCQQRQEKAAVRLPLIIVWTNGEHIDMLVNFEKYYTMWDW